MECSSENKSSQELIIVFSFKVNVQKKPKPKNQLSFLAVPDNMHVPDANYVFPEGNSSECKTVAIFISVKYLETRTVFHLEAKGNQPSNTAITQQFYKW